MRIGIDIDGTLTNEVDSVIAYGQEYELEHNLESGLINPSSSFIKNAFEWGDELGYKFWDEKAVYTKQVEPRPLTQKYIKKLHDEGHEIYIITARLDEEFKGDCKKASIKWLKKYKIPFDKIIVNAQNKGAICKANKIDAFIDDLPKNLDSVSDQGIKTYAMYSLSNESYKKEGVKKVYNFVDFYREINKLCSNKSGVKTYVMNVNKKSFKKIKRGEKTVELRLNDVRRQKININDVINFRLDRNPNKDFFAKVVRVEYYKDFLDLIWKEGKEKCGFKNKTMDQINCIMHKFYTEEEIKKYGVVALEIKPI